MMRKRFLQFHTLQLLNLRFCSSTTLTNENNDSSLLSSSSSSSKIMTPSSFHAEQSMNPASIYFRSSNYSPSDPASTADSNHLRLSSSFAEATKNIPLSQQFSRKEGATSLYHDIAPENLRFLYEAEQDELLGNDGANNNSNNNNNMQQGLEPDVPHFSTAGENQSYIDSENIQISRAHSFLGRDGDQSRKLKKREERDALNPGDGGTEEFGAAIRRFASKETNEALSIEHQLQQLLESSAPDAHKANVALEFTSQIQEKNLPVRARIVEEVFSLWNRVMQKGLLDRDKDLPLLLAGERRQEILSQAEKNESDNANKTPFAATLASAGVHVPPATTFLQPMLNLYFHTRRHFTAPTPAAIEHLMTALHVASNNAASPELMDVASRLMLDQDRYTVMATRITYATYFDMCALNAKMEIALVRFADAKDQLHLDADGGMVRSVVAGLVRNGLLGEALAFLARTKAVEVDVSYLNSILELLSLSSDPMASFTAFRSMEECGMIPNSTSFFHLLRACEASGQWDVGTGFVLVHMQKLRIKGDETTLNLLLKGLLLSKATTGLHKYANQLYLAMKQKATTVVFEEIEAALPENIRNRGKKLSEAYRRQQVDVEKIEENGTVGSNKSSDTLLEKKDINDGENAVAEVRNDQNRDREEEEFLRNLAALGHLSQQGRAPITVMSRYCLRKHLGTFEDQEMMRNFLAIKRKLRSINNNNNDNGEDDEVTNNNKHELLRISRSLRGRLWRYVHKSFYGVMPAPTHVVDMNLNSNKDYVRRLRERKMRRRRLEEGSRYANNNNNSRKMSS